MTLAEKVNLTTGTGYVALDGGTTRWSMADYVLGGSLKNVLVRRGVFRGMLLWIAPRAGDIGLTELDRLGIWGICLQDSPLGIRYGTITLEIY